MLDKEQERLRRRGFWTAVLTISLAVVCSGQAAPGAARQESAPKQAIELISLEESTRPLEQYFNQTKNQVRFLALLSPT